MPKDINGQDIDPNDLNNPVDVNQPENVAEEVLALGLVVATDESAQAFIDAIKTVMAANVTNGAPLQTAQQIIATAIPFLKLASPAL